VQIPAPEAIPLLARTCVDRVKVLSGVEVYGDRRSDLQEAIRRILHACFVDRHELVMAMVRARRRRRREARSDQMNPGHEAWRRALAWELAGLPAPAGRSAEPRRTDGELQGAGTRPLEVELCVALVQSGDFAEISATAAALGEAF